MTYTIRAYCGSCTSEQRIEIGDQDHKLLEEIKCPNCKSFGLKQLTD